MDERPGERPWTVYALTVWIAAGAIWALVDSEGNLLIAALWFAAGIVLARALWTGSRWAFVWSFMAASLCAGLTLTITLVQAFLLERSPGRGLFVPLLVAGILIALLLHPDTKRFAQVEARPRREAKLG